MREMKDEEIIRDAAHQHFLEKGDRVKAKAKSTAHSSYDVLRGPLTKYAYGRLGRSWQDAEDAVQDAYVKVLETAKVNEFFNFGGLYKIWLDRSIRDILKFKGRTNTVLVEDEVVEGAAGLTLIDLAVGSQPNTDLLIDTQSTINNIMEVSNSFKSKAKAIIRLHLIFGYSQKEVGGMLDIPVKKVENTMFYFKRKYNEIKI